MQLDEYAIVERAVEEGVQLGCNRAHKHSDTPSKEELTDKILTGVMEALSEVCVWQPQEVTVGESKEYKEIKDVLDVQTNSSECDGFRDQEPREKLQGIERALWLILWTFFVSVVGIPLVHFMYWYWVYFLIGGI